MRKKLLLALVCVLIAVAVAIAAIDSENKRANVRYIRNRFTALPRPDGSVTPGDRAHLSRRYRGFGDSEVSTGMTTTGPVITFLRRRR